MNERATDYIFEDRKEIIAEIAKTLESADANEVQKFREKMAVAYEDDEVLEYDLKDLAEIIYDDWGDWEEESFSPDYVCGIRKVDMLVEDIAYDYEERAERAEEEANREAELYNRDPWKYNGVSMSDFI